MEDYFLFLGTGGSLGVPIIGCSCEVCRSNSSFDKRMRSAGLFSVRGKKLLIDAGPDLRAQALAYSVTHLDGALITHTHFDHIAGLDDLRVYSFNREPLPCLLSVETFNELEKRYYYLLKRERCPFEFYVLETDFGQVEFVDLRIDYFSYYQADMKVTGFRIGDLSYVSDIRDYSLQVLESIQGTKTLILSALREGKSKVHFSLEEAIAFAKEVGAQKTYLTHIAHELSHEKTSLILPSNVFMAYDGLKLPLCY